MKKELTPRQITCVCALIIFGRLSFIGESAVGRDIWMVFLLVPLLGIPLLSIYSTLRVNRNTTDIFYFSLGKTLGKIAITLLSIVAIIIAASGITVFTVFISSTPVENSLTLPSIILMSVTIGILLYVSEGTLGRSSVLIFPFVSVLSIISFVFAIRHFDFGAILPILEDGRNKLYEGISTSVGLQIAPIIFLVLSTSTSTKPSKLRKALISGLILSCILLAIAHIRNLLILGYPSISIFRFPNYISLTQVKMGGLFQGMEIIITQAFLLCLPIKSAVCLRFIQRILTENMPKSKRLSPIILPLIAGTLSLLNYGDSYDKIISSIYFKIGLSSIMIFIPFIMAFSLLIRKIFSKKKQTV